MDTSFRNYKKTGFMSGEMEMSSSCLNSNSYLTLEATIDSPTLAQGTASYGYNWTVTSISAVNGVGTTEVDGTWWISNTSQMTSSPLASSCGSSAGSNYNEAVQYISLQPVILPEGMFAVGASLITWTCNLPQATFYDCPVEFFNPGDSDQQWVGSGCGGNVRIPGEGDGYEYSDPWEETFMGGGSVLGLQILAATISFDNSTGQMLVGPYSKISNAGDCTNLNFFDQTSGDWVLPTSITNNMPNDPGSGTFYPSPSPWGSPPSQTPFLQLYTSSKYNGNNAGYQNSQGGSPNIMVDNNNGAPAPSFLGGAAIWLKGNRIAIGLNTVPTLFATNEEVSIDAPPPPPS